MDKEIKLLSESDCSNLMSLAIEAREKSYCRYSNYSVGAALLASDGTVYIGCNIENSSYSATVCAERTAFFKAISDGKRDFSAIAISGGKKGSEPDKICSPCGICRQVMSEFCGDDFEIILGNKQNIKKYTLSELMPLRFELKDIT